MQQELRRPSWPAWFGLAALGLGFLAALFASGIVLAIVKATGSNAQADSAGVVIAGTIIQDAALVAAALWLAAKVAPPKPEQFGVRPFDFRQGLKWAGIAVVIFFAFQIVFVAAFHPNQKQTTLKDLGAGESPILTLAIGLLVVGIAPCVEEFFFRGFFFGALRNHMGFLAAALIDGLVFGAVHAGSGIEAVPTLMVLGFTFCLAFEKTGSILPGVVLHSLNNMVAFGSDKDGSWAVGALAAATVVAICVTTPWRSRTLT